MILVALMLAAGQAVPAPGAGAAQIDQLQLPSSPRRSAEAPPAPIPPRATDKSARVSQLPPELKPVGDEEGRLALAPPRPTEATRSAIEVARAIDVIRGRGQQPTPELIAREVGPEVLESYLNRALAPGQPPPGAAPDLPLDPSGAKQLPPGVTIVPKGGAQ